MSCHDISLILDTRDIRHLTTTERQSVETHLQGCAECASDWRAQQRVNGDQADLEMASDLPVRIWSSLELAASTKRAGIRSRTLVLGSLLLIGAAAAMIGWQLLRETAPGSVSIARPARMENGAVAKVDPSQAESTRSQKALDPEIPDKPSRHRLIVLPPLYQDPDAAAMEYFNAFYGAMLGELRSKTDLEIVEVTAQQLEVVEADLPPLPLAGPATQSSPPSATPPPDEDVSPLIAKLLERDIAIRQHFDGEFTLRVTFVAYPGRPTVRSINTGYSGPSLQGSMGLSSLTPPPQPGSSGSPSPGSPTSQAGDSGTSTARQVYARLLPESGSSQYMSVLKSPVESEAKRLHALEQLLQSKSRPGEARPGDLMTDEMVEGAVELSRSSSPETRRRILQLLGQTATPASWQALGRALRSEADPEARREAVNGLFKHVSDPAIRAEFELAATADESAEVRSLAKLALLPDNERSAYVLATLRDRSLTHQARMVPLMMARRRNLTFLSSLVLDEATISELMEIAQQSSDPVIKRAARSELIAARGGSLFSAPGTR